MSEPPSVDDTLLLGGDMPGTMQRLGLDRHERLAGGSGVLCDMCFRCEINEQRSSVAPTGGMPVSELHRVLSSRRNDVLSTSILQATCEERASILDPPNEVKRQKSLKAIRFNGGRGLAGAEEPP